MSSTANGVPWRLMFAVAFAVPAQPIAVAYGISVTVGLPRPESGCRLPVLVAKRVSFTFTVRSTGLSRTFVYEVVTVVPPVCARRVLPVVHAGPARTSR